MIDNLRENYANAIGKQIGIESNRQRNRILGFRDRSQTLVRGKGEPDTKRGPLKLLTLVRGGPEKITTNFPVKIIEFTYFSMGLTRNFHGKKGALIFFCGLKGVGSEKCSRYFFLHQPPSYKSL